MRAELICCSSSRYHLVLLIEQLIMDLSIVNNDYYLSGMATLIGEIDSKERTIACHWWYLFHIYSACLLLEQLMVMLRDGRTLIAYLRSLDQFGMCEAREACTD